MIQFEIEEQWVHPQGVRVGEVSKLVGGLTKREYYAAEAMKSLIMKEDELTQVGWTGNQIREIVVKTAFYYADAMIKESQNGPS